MSLQPPLPSSDVNPYAVTSTIPLEGQSDSDFRNAIYQSNGQLVMHKQAFLPNRCIKSNVATEERLKRTLYWHHPALYLLLVANLLIYALVATFVRKTAVIQIPLSAPHKKRRIRNMLIAWLSVLAGFGSMVVGAILSDSRSTSTLAILFFILFPTLVLFGALFGLYGCRVIHAKKIDNHFVWVAGVSREFRESFPDWPY